MWVAKGSPAVRRRVAVGVLLVAGLAVAAVVVLSDRERTAAATLAAARAAVDDAGSFRFTLEARRTPVAEASPTYLSTGEGEWVDGSWHVAGRDEVVAYEALLGPGDVVHTRSGSPSREGGMGQAWEATAVAEPLDRHERLAMLGRYARLDALPDQEQSSVDQTAVVVAEAVYLAGEGHGREAPAPFGVGSGPALGIGAEPWALLDTVDRLGTAVQLDGGTLTATLRAPADLAEAFGGPLPDGQIEIELGPGDRPAEVRLDVEAGLSSSHVELAYTGWDDPIRLPQPGGDADHTPWVDEDDLRETDVEPVAPPGLLESDGLRANVLPARLHYVDAPVDCKVVELRNRPLLFRSTAVDPPPPDDGGADPNVRLFQMSPACALATADEPFVPGGPGGRPSRVCCFGALQVLVGETVVEIGMSWEDADLDELVRSLAPVDPDALVTAAGDQPDGWTPAETLR